MSDTASQPSPLETPQSLVREIMEINESAQKYAYLERPISRLTTKETIERKGLPDVVMVLSSFAGFLVWMFIFGISGLTLGWDVVVPSSITISGFGMLFMGVGFGGFLQTKTFGKFWTRVARKKHYLILQEQEKSVQALELEAYEKTLTKHKQVTERLRKRSKPVIEAYTSANPLKKIEFSEGEGLVVTDRYEPEAQVALEISASVFSGTNEIASPTAKAIS